MGLIWLFGQVFGFLQPVLVPLAVAAIIAYLLDPIVRWFQKRGMTRGKAVVMTFGSATGLTLLLIAIMIPLVGNQIDQFKQRQIETNGSGSSQPGDTTAPEPKTFDEKIIDRLIGLDPHHPKIRIVLADMGDGRVVVLIAELFIGDLL